MGHNSRRNSLPSYLHHKRSGRARAVWTDLLGRRHDKLLPGLYGSTESKGAFAKLILEMQSATPIAATSKQPITVNRILVGFLVHADRHYRRADGTATNEIGEFKRVIRHVRNLYGTSPAKDFGPLALKAVRQRLIDGGACRGVVNQRINRVRHIFKWAVGEQLVAVAVHQALAAVPGLQRGRTTVRESEPVEQIADEKVDCTLPFLPRHVRGMVELQRMTGCRPGEACSIRRAEIDTGGTVWLYNPVQHKSTWRGKPRTIAIGPRAQELLREFFTASLEDYLFSPITAVREFHASRTLNRKTPGHVRTKRAKKTRNPQRVPTEKYDVTSYAHAVKRACDKAYPLPLALERRKGESRAKWWSRLTAEQKAAVKKWRRANHWHPNQLRHTHATKVRKLFGLEHAGAALGHSRMSATEIYAERDVGLAIEVAAKLG